MDKFHVYIHFIPYISAQHYTLYTICIIIKVKVEIFYTRRVFHQLPYVYIYTLTHSHSCCNIIVGFMNIFIYEFKSTSPASEPVNQPAVIRYYMVHNIKLCERLTCAIGIEEQSFVFFINVLTNQKPQNLFDCFFIFYFFIFGNCVFK